MARRCLTLSVLEHSSQQQITNLTLNQSIVLNYLCHAQQILVLSVASDTNVKSSQKLEIVTSDPNPPNLRRKQVLAGIAKPLYQTLVHALCPSTLKQFIEDA